MDFLAWLKVFTFLLFCFFVVGGWSLAADRLGQIKRMEQELTAEYNRGVKDMAEICKYATERPKGMRATAEHEQEE